jgi:allantoinase
VNAHSRIPFRFGGPAEPLPPLDGKPLMVHVVVNVEHWQFDAPMPRTLISSPQGRDSVPDVPNFSWVEYGMRCGLPRLLRVIGERGLPASVSLNTGVIDTYPAAADALLGSGWEFIAHGVHQQSLPTVEDERQVIDEALDRIERFTGTRPRGWLGPGLKQTFDTPDHLRRAGVDHIFDWVLDDLPDWMRTDAGPLLAMPYSLELNDSVIHAVEHYPSDETHRRVIATLEVLERELAEQPRMLTLPLHPHLMGVPHRVRHLARTLDLLAARDDTVFVTGTVVADWYRRVAPPPEGPSSTTAEGQGR